MKLLRSLRFLLLAFALCGCVVPPAPPQWSPIGESSPEEYIPYLTNGTASISGQAFLTQRGGGVVAAAGRTVTLDPATSSGSEWWTKAGRFWVHRNLLHPLPEFRKARRSTVADADGRFRFSGLPTGKYYIRTEVSWDVPTLGLQGGVVGRMVEIPTSTPIEVILNELAQ
jgi:hypothetical protein